MAYTPNFTANDVTVQRLEYVQFTYTGSTSPAVIGYLWQFSDGQSSIDAAPLLYFKTAGSVTVSLTAVFADGVQATETKTDYLTISEDTAVEYLALILSFYQERTKLKGLIKGIIDQYTLLDNQSEAMKSIRRISSSSGYLDDVGQLLGLPRLGRSNADYTTSMALMPAILSASGQLETIIGYTQAFLDPDILYIEEFPMEIRLDIVEPISQNYALFIERILHLSAAGVRITLAISDEGDVPLEFEYTDEPPDFADGNQLSEETYEENGFLAEEY